MTVDYRYLIDKSVLDVLKQILNDVGNNLYGERSFYISFRSSYQGVVLSEFIRQKYPNEITIVLQHQFKNLKVFEEKFVVNINFSGIAEDIEVPFAAITNFLDPLADFGFQFLLPKKPKLNNAYKASIFSSDVEFSEHKINISDEKAKVVAFDKFKKDREEKNKT